MEHAPLIHAAVHVKVSMDLRSLSFGERPEFTALAGAYMMYSI